MTSSLPRRDGSDGEVWPRVLNDDGTMRLEQTQPPNSYLVVKRNADDAEVVSTPCVVTEPKDEIIRLLTGAVAKLRREAAAPVRDVARLRGEPTPETEITEMSDTSRGLYNKYRVERTDGSSGPNGKHHACEYYVLDLMHDDYALPALIAYEMACREKYPALADDLALKIQQMKALRGTFFSGGVR